MEIPEDPKVAAMIEESMNQESPGEQQDRILEEKVEEKHSHQKVAAVIEESMIDGPVNHESPGEQQDQIL